VHARQATRLLPGHAGAACLLGFVHLQTPGGSAALAQKWLRRALALDPSCREAALALVTVYAPGDAWREAVAVLEAQLAQQPNDVMHLRLGEVFRYASRRAAGHRCYRRLLIHDACRDAGQFEQAMDHFQLAMGLNPYNAAASEALEALQRRAAPDAAGTASSAWPANGGAALEFNDAHMESAEI